MVKDIDVSIIIGANYGDEGKGRMSDYLANKAIQAGQSTITILSNGGAQRGHTVVLDNGFAHIFHHFGSGTLAGADTYLPQSFIVNPMIFMKEYNELLNSPLGRDTSLWPKIFVSPESLISTPFDMMNNQIIEEHRTHRHGSCGVGIWETILRQGATFYDFYTMTNDQLFTYLKWVRDTYSAKRLSSKNIKSFGAWKDIYFNDNMIHNYIKDFRQMSAVINVDMTGGSFLKSYDHLIFENGQGLLIDYDSDPVYSTPSYTGLKEPLKIINGLKEKDYNVNVEAYYISRSYYTRHGMGNLRFEYDPKDIRGLQLNLNSETNRFNTNQGMFRYGKINNFDDVIYSIEQDLYKNNFVVDNKNVNVVITHCDELDVPFNKIFGFGKTYKVYGPKRNDPVSIIN